jgi:subtilisin family serine protease
MLAEPYYYSGDAYYDRDDNGHGTHVAGIIAAQVNAVGVIGVAPAVELYSLKVLDANGRGEVSGIVAAIDWAVEHNIQIISMSLGMITKSTILEEACNTANEAGHLLIAAAGNSGNPSGIGANMDYPAKFDSVIAVGATDNNDQRASFSSTGEELDVMAPGEAIESTYHELGGRVLVESALYNHEVSFQSLLGSGLGTAAGPVVDCGQALSGATIAAALQENDIASGAAWIALIDRGTDTFAQKVLRAMEQGANAVIIVNNDTSNPDDPGKFSLEDQITTPPGDWVPSVSVSYDTGNMIRNEEIMAGSVTIGYITYETLRGTSMAAPHVAGAAAVVWSLAPALTNMQVRQILENTAVDLGLDVTKQGRGLICLPEAIDMATRVAGNPAVAMTSLTHDEEACLMGVEMEVLLRSGVHGQLLLALYDDIGRMLTCKSQSVEVLAYRQGVVMSVPYGNDQDPSVIRGFLVQDGFIPAGASFEALIP